MASQRLTGEDRLLAWVRRQLPRSLLGDDAAIVAGGPWAITVDSQVAGVHGPADLDPALLARRLLAVNLSDLAATGAVPRYAFLTLTTAPGFDRGRFFRAFLAACRSTGVELAGGDLASIASGWVATATLLGRRCARGKWLRRGGGRAGHRLWLGGSVGETAAGVALLAAGARARGRAISLPTSLPLAGHLALAARRAVRRALLPRPQLELGAWLARNGAGGVIDVSDGVARDLHRLCRESEVGACVDAAALPMASGFTELCAALGNDPRALALGGGEDYVLLFSLPARQAPPPHFHSQCIGELRRDLRITLRDEGRERQLPALGWDHLEGARRGPLGKTAGTPPKAYLKSF